MSKKIISIIIALVGLAALTTHLTGETGGSFKLIKKMSGAIAPKSVVHSGNGLFFAQNMMYQHTITVYNRKFELVKTISDKIKLSDYGFKGYSGSHRGAPVEAAFSHGGKYGWVSNYNMSGVGFNNAGHDKCSPKEKTDRSFVYRVNTETLAIDKVIKVGSVPKYVGVTPNNKYVLVTNWCTWDVSIIDTEQNKVIKSVYLGRYPRGIAISSDSKTAYIAVMGSYNIAILNLETFDVSWIKGVGRSPRHLNISPDGKFLYATLNGEGKVAKINLSTKETLNKIATGSAPRSMVLSGDGSYLYVVNYFSDTVSKVRTSDMKVLATRKTGVHPIGITYDAGTNQVWVSCYRALLMVFQD
ncbi:MAG: YncE family protein [Leptospirales bacterium]